MPTPPRVLITRPAAQAADWVDRLRACGLEALPLPLIDIAPPADTAEVVAAWQRLPAQRLVVFVSPNAVDQFFACRPGAVAAWPEGVTAASPGPGTTQALRRHGVPAAAIVEPEADAPQFDSESLWAQLSTHDWRNADGLIVRGTSGREWLADRLREAGLRLGFVSAYRRVVPQWSVQERGWLDAALQQPGRHVWLFSSGEAVDNLATLAASATWSASSAIATHARIAQRARQAGFGPVDEVRPAFDAVVGCIQSRAS